jgi:CBS domain-containing protein
VQDVMTPRSELATVTPHASLADALQLMARHNVNQVAVVEDGKLVGFVDRAAALQYLEIATTVRGDGSPSS